MKLLNTVFCSLPHKITFKNENLGEIRRKNHIIGYQQKQLHKIHSIPLLLFFQVPLGKIVNIIWVDPLKQPGVLSLFFKLSHLKHFQNVFNFCMVVHQVNLLINLMVSYLIFNSYIWPFKIKFHWTHWHVKTVQYFK